MRDVSNDRPHVDFVILADFSVASQDGMRQDFCPAANTHRAVNNNVRADICFGMNIRAWIDERGRMNGHKERVRCDVLRIAGCPLEHGTRTTFHVSR